MTTPYLFGDKCEGHSSVCGGQAEDGISLLHPEGHGMRDYCVSAAAHTGITAVIHRYTNITDCQ